MKVKGHARVKRRLCNVLHITLFLTVRSFLLHSLDADSAICDLPTDQLIEHVPLFLRSTSIDSKPLPAIHIPESWERLDITPDSNEDVTDGVKDEDAARTIDDEDEIVMWW